MSLQSIAGTAFLDRSYAIARPYSIAVWFRHVSNGLFSDAWFGNNTITNDTTVFFRDTGELQGEAASTDVNLVASPVSGRWYWVCGAWPASPATPPNFFVGNETSTSLITVVGGGAAADNLDSLTFLCTFGGGSTINGQEVAAKIYNRELQLADAQNEFLNLCPVQPCSNAYLPLLNTAQGGTDWSGHGNTFTKHGSPTTSSLMPPIPWGRPSLLLGG